jgi:hypothetical protein
MMCIKNSKRKLLNYSSQTLNPRPETRERVCCLLVLNLVSSTLSETRNPEQMDELTNRYLTATQKYTKEKMVNAQLQHQSSQAEVLQAYRGPLSKPSVSDQQNACTA